MNPYELLALTLRKLKHMKGIVKVSPIVRDSYPPQCYNATITTKDYTIHLRVTPRHA